MLGGHQRGARIDEFLLRIEHVERGALADAGFLAHGKTLLAHAFGKNPDWGRIATLLRGRR
jgi:hypothetical protein